MKTLVLTLTAIAFYGFSFAQEPAKNRKKIEDIENQDWIPAHKQYVKDLTAVRVAKISYELEQKKLKELQDELARAEKRTKPESKQEKKIEQLTNQIDEQEKKIEAAIPSGKTALEVEGEFTAKKMQILGELEYAKNHTTRESIISRSKHLQDRINSEHTKKALKHEIQSGILLAIEKKYGSRGRSYVFQQAALEKKEAMLAKRGKGKSNQ